MTQTQPDTNAPLTKAEAQALIAGMAPQGSGLIGLARGQEPVGLTHVRPQTGPLPAAVGSASIGAGSYGIPDKAGTWTRFNTAAQTVPYKTGDEQKPGGGTADAVAATQAKLVKAGLLSATGLRPGLWDAKSANAYKVVLAFANRYGMNADDAMTQFLNNPALQSSQTPAPERLTNPITAEAAVSGGGPHQTNTARELLGRDLSPAETKDFAAQYQAQEKSARDAYLKADLAGAATAPQAPDLATAAQDYIKQNHLADAVNYGTASRMLSFFDLLKGPV